MVINAFSQWLSIMKSTNSTAHHDPSGTTTTTTHSRMSSHNGHSSMISQLGSSNGLDLPHRGFVSLHDEIEIAKVVFGEIWDYQNLIHMESWGKLLQDIGRNVITKPVTDVQKGSPIRQIEYFSAPLAATDPVQVQESIQTFKGFVEHHPQLIKSIPSNTMTSTTMTPAAATEDISKPITLKFINQTIKAVEDRIKYDVLTGAKLPADQDASSSRRGNLSKKLRTDHPHKLPRTRSGGDSNEPLDRLMKECVKCRSRSMKELWNYHQIVQQGSSSLSQRSRLGGARTRLETKTTTMTTNTTDVDGNDREDLDPPRSEVTFDANSDEDLRRSLLGPFDFSIQEFKRRCICSGLWVTPPGPSPPSSL